MYTREGNQDTEQSQCLAMLANVQRACADRDILIERSL